MVETAETEKRRKQLTTISDYAGNQSQAIFRELQEKAKLMIRTQETNNHDLI
jgi:hypothetical protein